jgi:uncharacterized protein YgbK (DUF1537 family)
VLQRQTSRSVGLVDLDQVESGVNAVRDRFTSLINEGCHVAIVDAIADRHLNVIARASRSLGLVTGGAALGGAMAREFGGGQRRSGPTQPPHDRVAILSGSCSAATQEQIGRVTLSWPVRQIDPVALAETDGAAETLLDWTRDQARAGNVVVSSTAEPGVVRGVQQRLGREAAAAALEQTFGAVAVAAADAGIRTFVVTGGETSGAVLHALGVKALAFGDELAPGVPWAFSVDPPGFVFALKSGNFGGPDFLSSVLRRTA